MRAAQDQDLRFHRSEAAEKFPHPQIFRDLFGRQQFFDLIDQCLKRRAGQPAVRIMFFDDPFDPRQRLTVGGDHKNVLIQAGAFRVDIQRRHHRRRDPATDTFQVDGCGKGIAVYVDSLRPVLKHFNSQIHHPVGQLFWMMQLHIQLLGGILAARAPQSLVSLTFHICHAQLGVGPGSRDHGKFHSISLLFLVSS